jgi:ParB family chromosome partitioning protein
VFYCSTPQVHGYTAPQLRLTEATSKPVDPQARKIVLAGNRAWPTAAAVRHEWLAQRLFARQAAPAHTLRFVTEMLNRMPKPLGSRLHEVRPSDELYTMFAGKLSVEAIPTARAGRLHLLALLPIAVAFEHQMTRAGEWKASWRDNSDKFSACEPADVAPWLRYLIEAGYEASPIELAVAHGLPYAGDDVDYTASTAEPIVSGEDGSAQPPSQVDPTELGPDEDPLKAAAAPPPVPEQAPAYDVDAFVDPEVDSDVLPDDGVDASEGHQDINAAPGQ